MNLYRLMSSIRVALATNDGLMAWAATTYDRQLTINPSMDENDMPAEGDCPYVLVASGGRVVGNELTEKRHFVIVAAEVNDAEVASHPAIANLNEYKGQERLDDLRELVQGVITGMDLSGAVVREIEDDYQELMAFPFFSFRTVYEIVEYVAISEDRLT